MGVTYFICIKLILANASQKGCQAVIWYLSTSQEGKQREKLVLYQSSSWKLYDWRKPGKRNAGVSVIQSEAMTEGKRNPSVVLVIQSEGMTKGRKKKSRCYTSHPVWRKTGKRNAGYQSFRQKLWQKEVKRKAGVQVIQQEAMKEERRKEKSGIVPVIQSKL